MNDLTQLKAKQIKEEIEKLMNCIKMHGRCNVECRCATRIRLRLRTPEATYSCRRQ